VVEGDVVSAFNESVYYPYTSLKYHMLLVTALLHDCRHGPEFIDILLLVDRTGEPLAARVIELYGKTINIERRR